MSEDKLDNPSAFPREDYQTDRAPGQSGMTLRDYFAGQQLAAFRAHPANEPIGSTEHVAKYCYAMADAMLKARQS